jgi:choline dehydrogenase
LLDGLRQAVDIGDSPALRSFLGPCKLPGVGADNEALTQFLRGATGSINHMVGTCRAGTDSESVVDPQLRVHGVEGLRVVDASIMPTITRATTHAPSIMIGEHGSDLLFSEP